MTEKSDGKTILAEVIVAAVKVDTLAQVWNGEDISGDVVIENVSMEEIDFDNADFLGSVRVAHCVFTEDLSFHCAVVNGDFVLEDVMVVGDLILPENLDTILKRGRRVILKNLSITGELRFS